MLRCLNFMSCLLFIYGHTIPVVQQAKYFGIIFDNKLNSKAHIEYLLQKYLKDIKLLKIIFKKMEYRPQGHA